jgi:mannose-6-phosphate isomerase-like protein (cupin superfamily)
MEEKEKIISLNKAISDLDISHNYFLNVFSSKGLEAGILRLKEGDKDIQAPHSIDEIYFVVDGKGSLEIEGKINAVKRGDFIFVPANAHHKFTLDSTSKSLLVIYFFGS